MICPYIRSGLMQHSLTSNDFINEESGLLRNQIVTIKETYQQAKCYQEQCGAWSNGRCYYGRVKEE